MALPCLLATIFPFWLHVTILYLQFVIRSRGSQQSSPNRSVKVSEEERIEIRIVAMLSERRTFSLPPSNSFATIQISRVQRRLLVLPQSVGPRASHGIGNTFMQLHLTPPSFGFQHRVKSSLFLRSFTFG